MKILDVAVSRRTFVRSGIFFYGFNWLNARGASDAVSQKPPLPGSLKSNPRLDAWLKLHPDGFVTMLSGKVEIGQGILTALTQIVADELDVDIEKIKVISGDTARTPNEGVTSGSLSIQDSGTALRFACAEVRALLLHAGAKKLATDIESLSVQSGVITASSPNGITPKFVSYSELLEDINYAVLATATVKPKRSSEYKLIGSALKRRDIPGKVSGQPMYVQDIRLPGMVHARVVRPPAPRATLISVNTDSVLALEGVIKVVRSASFLGVIAKREEQAIAAARLLRESSQWSIPKDLPPQGEELFEFMLGQKTIDTVVSHKEDLSISLGTQQKIKRRYTRPYLAHASIGPSCALALWSDEATSTAHKQALLKVWCHSQGVFPLRGDLSKALGIAPELISVAHHEGSGCYGHNAADDVALDAALVARALPGTVVRLQWMREDEFTWEPLGSPMVVNLEAQLSEKGQILNWSHELWSYTHSTRPYDPAGCNLLASWYMENPLTAGPSRNIPQPSGGSDRNSIPLYDFPNQKVTNHLIEYMPIRTSALRTLGAFCNVLAIESFMDELAFESNKDPLAFRLMHLRDYRAIAVLEQVAQMANWGAQANGGNRDGQASPNSQTAHARLPDDSLSVNEKMGRGIAFAKYKNMAIYCAVIADVVVNLKSGLIRVTKAYASVDAGLIINPDGLKNQIEGGMIQATSWSLYEHVTYDSAQISTKNWNDYPILRFPHVPLIEVTLIDRKEEKSLGVGEGAHGPMAAAIANAVFAATQQRLRDIPLTLTKRLT